MFFNLVSESNNYSLDDFLSFPHYKTPQLLEKKDVLQICDEAVLLAGYVLRATRIRFDARGALSEAKRYDRLVTLLRIWDSGCRCVIDETLFSDVIERHPDVAHQVQMIARRLPSEETLQRAHAMLRQTLHLKV